MSPEQSKTHRLAQLAALIRQGRITFDAAAARAEHYARARSDHARERLLGPRLAAAADRLRVALESVQESAAEFSLALPDFRDSWRATLAPRDLEIARALRAAPQRILFPRGFGRTTRGGDTALEATMAAHDDFNLGQRVKITCSGEEGEVVGLAAFAHSGPQARVRYKAADGRACECWWDLSAIEAA